MNTSDPQFWQMISSIVIAICFIVMAIALIWIATTVRKVVATVNELKERVDPLIGKGRCDQRSGQRDVGAL